MKKLIEQGFFEERVVVNGNRFLIGNGYLGYRGTLDEFTAKDCVGLNVAGIYDGLPGKWRETVNAFNPFYLALYKGDDKLDVRSSNVKNHEIELDIEKGVFTRRTKFAIGGGTLKYECSRFCSMEKKTTLASRVILSSDVDMEITVLAGIDGNVWDLNGPHLENVVYRASGNCVEITANTQEQKIPMQVVCSFSINPMEVTGAIAKFKVHIKQGEAYVFDRIGYVLCGQDCNSEQEKKSYDELYFEHCLAWAKLWERADVEILGKNAEYAQFALRYSIYHLLTLAPKGDYSIAARGLSGQTYKGAVFWDTEMFILPFFLETDTSVAKRLVNYRIRTLDKARQKAAEYGYGGAFYAWESQDGFDACSDFNVTDVFTHRPVRTYFKDKQIHISADVAFGIWKYYEKTGDNELMWGGGLEAMLACAEFYRTYSYFNHVKNRYELLDVLGPDEYHERVNNNAYTNYMAHYTATKALELCKTLENLDKVKTQKITEKFCLQKIAEWVQGLYLPKCNEQGVLEQFDGYFKLEDVTVEEVKKRLVHPNEYWGGTTGIATPTRVIKQADVIMLLVLLPEYFPKNALASNYDFLFQIYRTRIFFVRFDVCLSGKSPW